MYVQNIIQIYVKAAYHLTSNFHFVEELTNPVETNLEESVEVVEASYRDPPG